MSGINLLNFLVVQTFLYSTPYIFTSIGGVFSERGGIVNVGLEGIMTIGAFSSVVFNLVFAKSLGGLTPWLAIVIGALIGGIFSLLHAVATINFRADHIISGTVLNLIAPALGVFLLEVFFNSGNVNISVNLGYMSVPLLDKIPILGPIFFTQTYLTSFIAVAVAILAWFVIFKTRFGLRLRSVGEHPQAADTLGINVYWYRYMGVILSGIMGGIGGAILAQSTANFAVTTIAGQGFISLAAMIFGKWNPIGAFFASLLFGLTTAVSVVYKNIPLISNVPQTLLQMLPYLVTIIVLALFLGKAVAPKFDGINYIKSK
ncbi:MAG: ABC transporter permease [Streptococcaceae bacterium]|jgi:simple sugar transport system permease protein|nr:ABC transporter permease [Streptococcaceae bacterium]